MRAALEKVKPADEQGQTDVVLMDALPTVPCNLLQIDFLKDEFDRRKGDTLLSLDKGDPSIVLAFRVLNLFLARARAVTGAPQVRPIDPQASHWRLDYLTDQGAELPEDPKVLRRRLGTFSHFEVCGIDDRLWNEIRVLGPETSIQPWDSLILDAKALLPEVGASIVVAFAALETFIDWALTYFASTPAVPAELWKWINSRDVQEKRPSVRDQFDDLLRIIAGKSLKEQPELWEAFQNIRKARNSFVHEGRATLAGKEVTPELAAALVQQADRILSWVEEMLPETMRRPRSRLRVEITIHLRP